MQNVKDVKMFQLGYDTIAPSRYIIVIFASTPEFFIRTSPDFPYCRIYCWKYSYPHFQICSSYPGPTRVGIFAFRHIFAKKYFMNINCGPATFEKRVFEPSKEET